MMETRPEPKGDAGNSPSQSSFVAFGQIFATTTFETDDEANAYMESNPGYGLIGIDIKGLRHVAKNDDEGTKLSPVQQLRCCCCGDWFDGRQFYNQDTGFGLGDCCVEFVTKRTEDMPRTYGRAGIHYNVGNPNT